MYGIWHTMQKRFVFGIAETTVGRAQRALFQRIGKNAYKWRFEVRKIPPNWHNPPNPNYTPVRCEDCEWLVFSDCYGECGKGYKGIVRPGDSCGKGIKRRGHGIRG